MTNTMVSEKRRYPRIPVGISMDIAAACQEVGKVRGTIADLSQGGMTLKTNAELEEGMTLHLRLPDMAIRGEVRHAQDSEASGLRRYGVRFHKIHK